MVLNGGKSSIIGVLPVLFIPFSCKKIIRNSSDTFSTFLRPLIDELEQLFIKGIDVFYNYPVEQIFDVSFGKTKLCNLRAMLMMVTGDHPAQCKIGLFKDGGQSFCRRDKAQATLDVTNPSFQGRYVYDGNRFQARYPPPKRSLTEMVEALSQSRKAFTQVEREGILKTAGLSGESILWRLYDLYGFNLSLDLVYDAMHVFSLNVFSKYITSLMRASTNETKRAIDSCVEVVSKIAPSSIRYGRWPHVPSKHHESFKAEENQKFMQWCLPYILNKIEGIPKHLHDLGILLIDIAHSFYNYSRDNGWSKETMKTVRALLLAWRVKKEESLGANSSPLEHVAGSYTILLDVNLLNI